MNKHLSRCRLISHIRDWHKKEAQAFISLIFCTQGLTITDLEDLLEDIKVYLELEQGKNTEYWRDIVTVTEDELLKLKKLDSTRGKTNSNNKVLISLRLHIGTFIYILNCITWEH